jgi:S1-C subfamily serine protease
VVREVQPGSPAERAGLVGLRVERTGRPRLGDVITAVDGAPVDDVNDLLRALDTRAVGDAVVLAVSRDGAAREVQVTLAAVD